VNLENKKRRFPLVNKLDKTRRIVIIVLIHPG